MRLYSANYAQVMLILMKNFVIGMHLLRGEVLAYHFIHIIAGTYILLSVVIV